MTTWERHGTMMRRRLGELGVPVVVPSIWRGAAWALVIEAWMGLVVWGAVSGWRYVGR